MTKFRDKLNNSMDNFYVPILDDPDYDDVFYDYYDQVHEELLRKKRESSKESSSINEEEFRKEFRRFHEDMKYEKHLYFRSGPPPEPVYHTVSPKKETKEKPMSSEAETILRDALKKAKETIQEQNEVLQQLLAAPTSRGYVVQYDTFKVLVSIPGAGLVEVLFPHKEVNGKNLGKLIKNGCMVRVQMDPVPAIQDVLPLNLDAGSTGDVVTVTKDGNNSECEVEFNGSNRIVRFGSDIKIPEVGERLLVDGDCHVAIRNLGVDASKFSFQGITGVDWDDIGGLHTAKEALQEAIELPFLHPDLYSLYGKKNIKGVLLYGPPGCGKTMLAKAAATSLSKLHSRTQAATGFIYVKGPELLNKFVGNTEAQVRSLFAQARKHQKKHGYPAVIFIDEADALLGVRGSREGMGIESTVVPQFLAEMDGLDDTGAIVLLATNRPDSLDSAVTRDGRIDTKVQVTRPSQSDAVNIFKLYLKGKPLVNFSEDEMATLAAKFLYSADYRMYEINHGAAYVTLGNMVNGAMIAGMVDKASTIALRRDLANAKQSGDKPRGITVEDLAQAAKSIYEQTRHLNHAEEVREFVELNQLSANQISKAQNAAA